MDTLLIQNMVHGTVVNAIRYRWSECTNSALEILADLRDIVDDNYQNLPNDCELHKRFNHACLNSVEDIDITHKKSRQYTRDNFECMQRNAYNVGTIAFADEDIKDFISKSDMNVRVSWAFDARGNLDIARSSFDLRSMLLHGNVQTVKEYYGFDDAVIQRLKDNPEHIILSDNSLNNAFIYVLTLPVCWYDADEQRFYGKY